MWDGYKLQLSGGLMDGDSLVFSLPETILEQTGYDFEAYVHSPEIASDGSSQTLEADVLDNARALVIIGGEGVEVTLGSTGTDAIPADPVLLVSNEDDGTGYDQITITNNSSEERKVVVMACSYKT